METNRGLPVGDSSSRDLVAGVRDGGVAISHDSPRCLRKIGSRGTSSSSCTEAAQANETESEVKDAIRYSADRPRPTNKVLVILNLEIQYSRLRLGINSPKF